MNEIKIAERIIVDEPQNVEIAICNLTGKKTDFELVKKFILNETNTMFYIDSKMNSSTDYGMCTDYLWLDTGFRDLKNQPIMICLHNGYNGYVGHYTGTVRVLANRVKSFNSRNAKDIERNYSRFISKYRAKAKERKHEFIDDEMTYLLDVANRTETEASSGFAMALDGVELSLTEDYFEEPVAEEKAEVIEDEFTKEQNDITVGILFDQMEKMQNYIDELLAHIENNEKESQEEIARLKAQNQEYKQALVNIRTFVHEEESNQKDEKSESNDGHNLLGRNEKILVLGNTDIRVAEMKAIARDYFGFDKADFEFVTDYDKIKNSCLRIYGSERFAAVIFGNCPHKVAGMGNYASIIDEFRQRADCPISIDARNEAGGLKITKQSFKKALAKVYNELKAQAA